jgi:hypothetical protein
VESEQLLTQGKIFEDDILAGPECTNNPAEEVPEPYDHAQNLTGTLSIEIGAKSLILRVYDVLMNDTVIPPESTHPISHKKTSGQRRHSYGKKTHLRFQGRSLPDRRLMPLPAHSTSADHPVVPCNAQFRGPRSLLDSASSWSTVPVMYASMRAQIIPEPP